MFFQGEDGRPGFPGLPGLFSIFFVFLIKHCFSSVYRWKWCKR